VNVSFGFWGLAGHNAGAPVPLDMPTRVTPVPLYACCRSEEPKFQAARPDRVGFGGEGSEHSFHQAYVV